MLSFFRAPEKTSEPSVRGHVERVTRMQFSGSNMGQAKKTLPKQKFVYVPTGLRTGVLLMCGLGVWSGAIMKAQSAGTWNSRGMSAEAREDYDAAFEAFRQAHLKKPKDLRYKTRYERLRFEAANMHVDRGRVLRQSSDVGGAMTEFSRALQIDPGNQAAAQELASLQNGSGGAGGSQAPAGGAAGPNPGKPLNPQLGEQTPYQRQLQRDILSLASPITLQPVSDDPISLHLVEDTKVVYQSICKAAGLNVIFDPEYTAKRIPVDLTSVSLSDALRIVGTLSGTFWKPITTNTIFVAANTRQKRGDLDDMAVQTFYLNNVSQPNDANEIMVTLRNVLDPTVKVYLVGSQNAIVLRATPDELLLAQKIINDLDRTRAEVVVDVAVLEVSRNLERNLGITLPTSFGLTPQASNYNVSTSSTTTSTSSTTNGLTLNTLANINATNFAVTVTGGTVNALLSDADTRILQNPRVRATDGQKSTLKIGSKIPIATGSYNAGVSTGVASVGVQTQFTYLDVGVNIEITPTVHYDREVSLKLRVEVSAQNGSVTISSVTEPIISQRVAEQVIQLKDGEPSILAGLLQQQDTKSVTGTPGLGELPLLKYFFSSTDKTQATDEIVFLVIPHIVRESIFTDENKRSIYTGSGQSIELIRQDPDKARRLEEQQNAAAGLPTPAAGQATAAQAAKAMIGQIADAAKPMSPSSPPVSTPNVPANTTPVSMTVMPQASTVQMGSTFQVAVMVNNARDLFSVPLQVQFDPKVLQLQDVNEGNLLEKGGQTVTLLHRDDGAGGVSLQASRQINQAGVDGQGTLCTLTFKAIATGDSAITLQKVGAKDSKQNSLPAMGIPATVHVK